MLLAAVAVAAVVAPLTERGAAALLLRPRRGAAGAGHLCDVPDPRGRDQADLGRQPVFRLGALQPVRQRRASARRPTSATTSCWWRWRSVVGLAVWWGLNRTRHGKIVLAVIHSAEVASSMGVNVSRVYMLAFTIGIFLAAHRRRVHRADDLGVARHLGGRDHRLLRGGDHRRPGQHRGRGDRRADRRPGALAGGAPAPVAELFSIYIVMAIVLMFRPEGLFQRIQARKI